MTSQMRPGSRFSNANSTSLTNFNSPLRRQGNFVTLNPPLRQWFLLIVATSMIVYFTYAMIVLRKTQRKITFEFVIFFIEVIKLLLIIFHEFLFVSLMFLVIVMIFQSQIRAIVNANFIKKYFEMKEQHTKLRQYYRFLNNQPYRFYFVYYGLIVSTNIIILILSVIPKTRVECDQVAFSYQFYVVCLVDLIQSILISYFAYQLKTIIKKKRTDDQVRFSQGEQRALLEDDVRGQCLEKQITYMSVFYVVFSVIDLLILGIGDLIQKKMFICTNGVFLLPRDDFGCGYLLLDSITFFAFSFNIIFIFFKIPDQHGLLVKHLQADSDDHLSLKMTFVSKLLPNNSSKNEFGETLIDGNNRKSQTNQPAEQINTEKGSTREGQMDLQGPQSRTDMIVAQIQVLSGE